MATIKTPYLGWRVGPDHMTPVEGVKHDADKPRWDLLPIRVTEEVVQVLTFGAQKYGDDNWRRVPDARRRYYAAAMRHLSAYWQGLEEDQDTGLGHLAHAICCLMFLEEVRLDEHLEHDDQEG